MSLKNVVVCGLSLFPDGASSWPQDHRSGHLCYSVVSKMCGPQALKWQGHKCMDKSYHQLSRWMYFREGVTSCPLLFNIMSP